MQLPLEPFDTELGDKAVAAKDIEAYCWAMLQHLERNTDYFARKHGVHYFAAAVDRMMTPLLRIKLGGLEGMGGGKGNPFAQGDSETNAAFGLQPTSVETEDAEL